MPTVEDRVTQSDKELHVGLEVPLHAGRAIHRWARDFAWPEGTALEPPSEYHITLLYTPEGHDEHKDAWWLQHMDQAEVKVTGIDAFSAQDKGYAYVLRIDSPEIEEKAQEMQGRAEAMGLPITKFPGGYKPHITVAYGPASRLTGASVPDFHFDVGPSSVSPVRPKKEASRLAFGPQMRAHYNRWTGKVCHCGWGHPKPKGIGRTAGLEARKLQKAPDKAYRTPEGQAFIQHMATMPEALHENADWGDEDHQQALHHWNYGNPQHNLHPPEPSQPPPPSGQMNFGPLPPFGQPVPGTFSHLADRQPYNPDEVQILDQLSLTNVAANLHYRFEQNGLDAEEAVEYAKKLLNLIGYPPDDITVQAALQAWQQLYPQDQIPETPSQLTQAPPTVPTESFGYGATSRYNEWNEDEEHQTGHQVVAASQEAFAPSFRQGFSPKFSEGDAEAQVEPVFPDTNDAQEIHAQSLEDHQQAPEALWNPGGLESAMGRAANYWHYGTGTPGERIADAAGALAHGVGMSQAFTDGNKRTAYHTTRYFLHTNGYNHLSPLEHDDEELADHLIGHGEGTHRLEDTQQLFRSRLQPEDRTARVAHEPSLTLYHGTTNRALDHARQRGAFESWHPRDVANEVATHYGLDPEEFYNHPYFEFSRGRHADPHLYLTTDPQVAQHYAQARSEQLEDALNTAHRMLHPQMYNDAAVEGFAGTPDQYHRQVLNQAKKQFRDEYHQAHNIQPQVVTFNVPHSAIPEDQRRLWDEGVPDTYMVPGPIPLDWMVSEKFGTTHRGLTYSFDHTPLTKSAYDDWSDWENAIPEQYLREQPITPWTHGLNGKGLILPDHTLRHWSTNQMGDPHHDDVAAREGHNYLAKVDMRPDGTAGLTQPDETSLNGIDRDTAEELLAKLAPQHGLRFKPGYFAKRRQWSPTLHPLTQGADIDPVFGVLHRGETTLDAVASNVFGVQKLTVADGGGSDLLAVEDVPHSRHSLPQTCENCKSPLEGGRCPNCSTVPSEVNNPEDRFPDFGDPSPNQRHHDVQFGNDWAFRSGNIQAMTSLPADIEDPRWDGLYSDWSDTHDYDPRWDYSEELRPEWHSHPLVQQAQVRLNTHTPNGRVFAADLSKRNVVGVYAFGTGADAPAILFDPYQHERHTETPDEALTQTLHTIDHEYRHAQQEEMSGGEPDWDEDDAEHWHPGMT